MRTIDQLMALPEAGAAALVAHRWAAKQPEAGSINAFDMLGCLAGLQALPADRLQQIVATISKGDADACRALSVLHYLVDIDFNASRFMAYGAFAKASAIRLNARQKAVTLFLHLSGEHAEKGGSA